MFPTDPEPPRWTRRLNESQLSAASHHGPSLLVVAGAGTGKTGTIAARVARLIEDGVAPQRILLLTFTRRAAQELMQRAGSLSDSEAAGRVWGGTFHSVANRVLRQHGASLGLDPSFTVLDPSDVVDMFGLLRSDHVDTSGPRLPRKETIAALYDRVVGTQRPLADVLATEFPWCAGHAEVYPALFSAYTTRKRRRQVLDYTDLLLFWRAAMANPVVGRSIADRFDHVCVDEFQDTDPIQADIVHSLGDAGVEITAVGDDAQAIYGFRSATVENMWRFESRRPGTTVLTLEDNYRSIGPILDVANDVLAASDTHIDKTLVAHRAGDRRPELVTCNDEVSQAVAVANRILELREEGVALADQAVLFRTGHHSDLLELELGRREIPFLKFGGLKFLEAAHVKDLVALLRVLDNPWDELAWSRVLGSFDGVGPGTTRRVLDQLGLGPTEPERTGPTEPERTGPTEQPGDGGNPLWRFLHDRPPLPSSAREEADQLADAWNDCLGTGADAPPVAMQVERLAQWCEAGFDRRYDRSEIRVGDLHQLRLTAEAYTNRSQFLTELTLEPPASVGDLADEPHLDDEYLTLSTVHSAKGCEWGAVHLIHAADGAFPADMSLGSKDGLEEERRLMYVAVTRARDHLAVYVPLRYHHSRQRGDRHSYAPLSRFLSPIRHRFDERGDGTPDDSEPPTIGGDRVTVADEVDAAVYGLWA